MGQYLPEHILIAEVLHRLPVKSLVRFRCVSKTWHHVIHSSSFIKTHLTYQKDSLLEKYVLYESYPLCYLLTKRDSIFDLPKISKRYFTPSFTWISVSLNYIFRGGLRVYGICNGLLCFSDRCYRIGDGIHLWNPSCYKIKKLPEIDISVRPTSQASVSFGYYKEDYKVIVLAPIDDTYIVFVYSLSTNSWNTIRPKYFHQHILPPYQIDSVYSDIIKYAGFVDGTAYMITDKVTCFDLSDETIQVIDFPNEFFLWGTRLISFTVEAYGETIAIFACDRDYWSFNMWILKHRSSSSTSPWEKKFVFVLQEAAPLWSCARCLSGVGFLNNGKYVARSREDEQGMIKFFECDFEFQKLVELRSLCAANHSLHETSGRIHSNYVESLMLLDEDGIESPSLDILQKTPCYGRRKTYLFS